MIIGQFSDTFLPIVDGVGRVVYNYATEIPRLGHECYVVTPYQNFGYRGGLLFDLINYVSAALPGLPQYKLGTPDLDARYNERIKTVPFDIVHAHTPFVAGSEARRVARKLGIPLVGSFHSKYYDDFYKVTKMRTAAEFGTDIVVRFFNDCDDVWAVSKTTADVLHDYGYKKDIFVVENGVSFAEPDQQAAEEVGKEYGLGNLPVLLFVGQMNWKKNIKTVLEAAAMLKKRGLSFKLVLAGQGPDTDSIRQKTDELGIGSDTVFTGHITESRKLNGLYLRSALFVFLSEYDNAPMVVREAAVMSTPSLLVRGSCAAEVVIDGYNGLLCENSAADAADKIASVLEFPDDLARLGQTARTTIPIGWSSIITHACERYAELVASKASGRTRKRRFTRD